jgi:putative tricarboxylic transport membrane protein
VIGLILGPLAEAQFRRALSISQGDWTVFFVDPLSATLLAIAALAVLGPFLWRLWRRHRQPRHL